MLRVLKNKIFITLIVILIIISCIFEFLYYKYPTTSPFNSVYYYFLTITNPHVKMGKESIGFLTYWRSEDSDLKQIQSNLLSEIIYFSLSIDKDGNIIKVVNNETDPGWLKWQNSKIKDLIAKTQIMGGRFSLSVSMLKNSTLESFLNNKRAQDNLILEIKEQIAKNKLDGINLDFEYAGSPSADLKNKFTYFVKNFSANLKHEYPKIKLSIDVFPLAIRKERLIEIPKIKPYFDKIIIMGYDFYGTYSDVAGPIAPMRGYNEKKYIFDIENTYNDFSKYIKQDKLILGIPYYGYDWPVENETEFMSKTLEQNDENGYVETLSYSRMRKDKKFNSKINCKWDELAKEPWCWYLDKNKIARQAWFENNKSIEIKFDFVNSKDLGGVALWTLGYDRDFIDLWDMLKIKYGQ